MRMREGAVGEETRVLLPHALGSCAVLKIFKKAIRLFTTRFRLFLFFTLAFYVPAHSLMPYLILQWSTQRSGHREEPPPQHNLAVHHAFNFFMTSQQPQGVEVNGDAPLFDLLIITIMQTLQWILLSSAIASFIKCVAYIYDDQQDDCSVIKDVLKSLPHKVLLFMITNIWGTLLTLMVIVVPISIYSKLVDSTSRMRDFYIAVDFIVGFMAFEVVVFFLFVAGPITVLESSVYGFAAIKKSSNLVMKKGKAILGVLVVQNCITGALLGITYAATQSAETMLTNWTFQIFRIGFSILQIIVNVYLQLIPTVVYFSCKPNTEDESTSIPIYNHEGN